MADSLLGTQGQIADTRKGFRHGYAGNIGKAEQTGKGCTLQDHGGTHCHGDRLRPVFGRVIHDFTGNLFDSLGPGNALPLTFATFARSFHRIQRTLLAVHVLSLPQTLLTTAWPVIRSILAGCAVFSLLLFAPDDAVTHVNIESAMAGTVNAAAATHDPIPGPLITGDVFPPPVSSAFMACSARCAVLER